MTRNEGGQSVTWARMLVDPMASMTQLMRENSIITTEVTPLVATVSCMVLPCRMSTNCVQTVYKLCTNIMKGIFNLLTSLELAFQLLTLYNVFFSVLKVHKLQFSFLKTKLYWISAKFPFSMEVYLGSGVCRTVDLYPWGHEHPGGHKGAAVTQVIPPGDVEYTLNTRHSGQTNGFHQRH